LITSIMFSLQYRPTPKKK